MRTVDGKTLLFYPNCHNSFTLWNVVIRKPGLSRWVAKGSVVPASGSPLVSIRIGQYRLRGQLVAVFDIPQLPMRGGAMSIEFGWPPPIPMLLMLYPVLLITSLRLRTTGAGPIDTGADSASSLNSRRCRVHHVSTRAG